MFWTDGSIYKGEWVKGIQHGYGEMLFPDGTKKVGVFDHNTFVSPTENNQDNSRKSQLRSRDYDDKNNNTIQEEEQSTEKDLNRRSDQEFYLQVPKERIKQSRKISREQNKNNSVHIPQTSNLSKRNNFKRTSLINRDIEDIDRPNYMNYKYENNDGGNDGYTPIKFRPSPSNLPAIHERSTKTNYGSRK